MSYAVCHVKKFKAGDVTGLQIHNNRQVDHSHTNQDIDYSRSHLNYDLHTQEQVIYRHAINERIEQLHLERAVRKDATVMAGVVITSDQAFFKDMSPEQSRQFFKDAYDFLGERYGRENIISARVHMDETTPHMHLCFVPVTPDQRLCAKEVFKPSEYHELQEAFHAHMVARGYDLQRGCTSDGKRKHLDTLDYKVQQAEQRVQQAQERTERAEGMVKTQDATITQQRGEIERLQREVKDTQRTVAERIGAADKYATQKIGSADKYAADVTKAADRDAERTRAGARDERDAMLTRAKGEVEELRREIPALQEQKAVAEKELAEVRDAAEYRALEPVKVERKMFSQEPVRYTITAEDFKRYQGMMQKGHDLERQLYVQGQQLDRQDRLRGENDNLVRENRQLRRDRDELTLTVKGRVTYINRVHDYFDKNPEIGEKAMAHVQGLEKEQERAERVEKFRANLKPDEQKWLDRHLQAGDTEKADKILDIAEQRQKDEPVIERNRGFDIGGR